MFAPVTRPCGALMAQRAIVTQQHLVAAGLSKLAMLQPQDAIGLAGRRETTAAASADRSPASE
jgi:hypothetical protein